MLFAEEVQGNHWAWITALQIVITMIVAAVTGLIVKLWPLLMRSKALTARLGREQQTLDEEIRRKAHDQVTAEFHDMLDRAQSDADRRDSLIAKQDQRIEELFGQVRELTQGHADCLVKNERLATRLAVLEATLDTVQTQQAIAGLPTRNEAIIIVCDRQIIREWNNAATAMFHWKMH